MKNTGLKRVFVGMSGGVDSSVSAALLKRAGYDVTGVFIKVWQPEWLECTWREERRDAMRVAAHLDIPFVTLDLEQEYKKEVVDYMIQEYKEGRTPNPDVMCNKYVKFGGFFDWAISQGAEYVATGHYASVEKGTQNEGDAMSLYQLKMSADTNKDQTYFLWTLTQKQLRQTLFPIGDMEKSEVRKLATRFKLPTAEKKDSQGLCFIGMVDMKEFLSHYIPLQQGDVLNVQGKKIGSHAGAFLFTVGERHGFVITEKTPHDTPYYVVSKDIENNTITVSQKTDHGVLPLTSKRVTLRDTIWNQGSIPTQVELMARARYREELTPIRFQDQHTFEFVTQAHLVSPGQSVVVYDGAVCLGGGVIV